MAPPALALLAAIALQAPAAPFVSKEGGFRISLPSEPSEKTQQIPSPIGTIEAHFFQAKRGDVEYVVSYNDYPDKVGQADPDKVLDGAANGAVGGVNGAKLLKKQDRKIGQVPGKEIEFSFPGPNGADGLGRARLYLSGTRMYSIMIRGPKADVLAASDAYFRSFGLSTPTTAAATKPGTAPARPTSPGNRPGMANRPGPAGRAGPAERPAMANRVRPGVGEPAAAAATPAGKPGPFVSVEQGFRVSLPGKPQEQTVTQPSPIGQIEVKVFVAQMAGLTYVVTATKLPPQAAGEDPKQGLEGVVKGTISSTKGTLVSEKEIKLGKDPGKEFEFEMKGADGAANYTRSRAFVANGRIYQLLLAGPKDSVRGPAGDAFLQSFALTTP